MQNVPKDSQPDPPESSRNLSFLPQPQAVEDEEPVEGLSLPMALPLSPEGLASRRGLRRSVGHHNSLRTNFPGTKERPSQASWQRGEARDPFSSHDHTAEHAVMEAVGVGVPWSLITVPKPRE